MANIFNDASCKEGIANCFEGSPEEVIFSDGILWKVAHIVKGFLVVVIFSVVIVEKDGIIVSLGSKVLRYVLSSIPLCDP